MATALQLLVRAFAKQLVASVSMKITTLFGSLTPNPAESKEMSDYDRKWERFLTRHFGQTSASLMIAVFKVSLVLGALGLIGRALA